MSNRQAKIEIISTITAKFFYESFLLFVAIIDQTRSLICFESHIMNSICQQFNLSIRKIDLTYLSENAPRHHTFDVIDDNFYIKTGQTIGEISFVGEHILILSEGRVFYKSREFDIYYQIILPKYVNARQCKIFATDIWILTECDKIYYLPIDDIANNCNGAARPLNIEHDGSQIIDFRMTIDYLNNYIVTDAAIVYNMTLNECGNAITLSEIMQRDNISTPITCTILEAYSKLRTRSRSWNSSQHGLFSDVLNIKHFIHFGSFFSQRVVIVVSDNDEFYFCSNINHTNINFEIIARPDFLPDSPIDGIILVSKHTKPKIAFLCDGKYFITEFRHKTFTFEYCFQDHHTHTYNLQRRMTNTKRALQ